MESEKIEIKRLGIKHELKKRERRLLSKRFFSNPLLLFGSVILLLFILIATFGPLLTPYHPNEMIVADRLMKPNSKYWLGTDDFGRDLLTRLMYGARASMGVGFVVTIITSILGMIIGLLSSYFRTLDNILMRIMDGLMAFPSILLAIALMSALGPKTENVIIALSIVFTPYIARVVRSAALSVKEEIYIEAIKTQGASTIRILGAHIAPNVTSPLIIQATFIFADSIINEASLSFLGAGVPAPNPSWGSILRDGQLVLMQGWWMILFSGVVIILSVLALNLIGDGLRDFLDPQIISKKK